MVENARVEFYGRRIRRDRQTDDDETSVSRVDESAGQAPAPARAPALSATARGWPKAELLDRANQSTKRKPLTSNTTDADDKEDVTVI